MTAATHVKPSSPDVAEPAGQHKSKLLTVALAFVFGSLGIHRFYLRGLRDPLAWAHLLATVVGVLGIASLRLGAGTPAFNWAFAVAGGASVIGAFLGAIVYGLRADDKWDATFNSRGTPTRSGWPVVILIILSLMIGTGLLMAGLAISFQTFFESQVEAARALSQ